jgi:hypothetical protein
MRRRRIIIIALVVLLVPGLFFLISVNRVPNLQVMVVNESGTPVQGATIQPDGIRGTDRAHYSWGESFAVKPLTLTTDKKGVARIPFPRYIVERVRSIELSFGVDHPDYSPQRPFVQVGSPIRSTTPFVQRLQFIYSDFIESAKTEQIVLKRGATIELSGTLNGRSISSTNIHAQLVPADGVFDGKFVRDGFQLRSKKVPAGDFMVRAFSEMDGTNYFSELLKLRGVAGETNSVAVDLKPGHSVEGRISGVDGEVKNGWVNVRVINAGAQLMSWADFAEIRDDGTFNLNGLPAGRLECVALCDGYLSENPPTNRLYSVNPHTFEIPGTAEVAIPMRKSATANIRVVGPDGKPVEGASVGFWPNVRWGEWSSTIFASDFYREPEGWAREDGLAWKARRVKRQFSAKTDQDGRAVILELPPETLEFAVTHPDFELPLDTASGHRNLSMRLVGGETNFAGAQLRPKGSQQRD